jgi:hypothetical protein
MGKVKPNVGFSWAATALPEAEVFQGEENLPVSSAVSSKPRRKDPVLLGLEDSNGIRVLIVLFYHQMISRISQSSSSKCKRTKG